MNWPVCWVTTGTPSGDVFQSIFAFTLDELHDEGLLSDDSVNRQIYSVGIGATRLPAALDTLERQKREIFLPRGRNQTVLEVIGRIEETESELGTVADHATEYRRQSDRLAEIDGELKDVGERRLQLMSKMERHQNLIRAWDPWNGLINAERTLAELPAVEAFPENGTILLESLEARTEAALQEFSSADERVKRIKANVDEEIEHLVILESSNEVRELERRRSAFDQSVKDLPERRAELSSKRSELDTSLANLGPDWDAQRLSSFDLSLVVREEVANYGERLQNARTSIERSQTALAQEETVLVDAQEDAERAQVDRDNAASPELDKNDIRERCRQIRQSRNTLAALERVEERSKDLKEQIDDEPEIGSATPSGGGSRLLAGVLGVLGVALLLVGIWLALSATPGGRAILAFIGAVLFTAAAFLFIRGRSPIGATASPVSARIRRQIHQADEQLGGIRSRLQEEADALGLEAIDADALVEAEEGLDTADGRLREWQQL